MNINNVILSGRVAQEINLKKTSNGKSVTTIILAVDKGLSKDKKEEFEKAGKQTANFVPVLLWERNAEIVSKYSKKGLRLAITGSVETRHYVTESGENRYITEVLAKQVEIIDFVDKATTNAIDDEVEYMTDEEFENNGY